MSDLKLDIVSIVVLSDGNNPRLLNQDFLRGNKVVPDDYVMNEVIVTPPLSQVIYKNGLRIQMDEHKLTFVVGRPSEISWQKVLPEIVNRFLEVLCHVAYKSVGLNFTLLSGAITGIPAETELINNLLVKGKWFDFNDGVTGALVELQFRNNLPHLSIKMAIKETASGSGSKFIGGPFLIANYHHDFAAGDTKKRRDFINDIEKYEQQIHQFSKLLPVFNIERKQ